MRIELRTERLVVRPWREAEAGILHDIRGRPEVGRWLGNGDEALSASVRQMREHIERWNAGATTGVPRGCAIVPHGRDRPVGTVLVGPLVSATPGPADAEVEIGWHLHPDAGGHGWASEAAGAMLAHALEHHDRVFAIMWPANEPSARVAQRIGMHDLGQALDPWYGSAAHPHSRIFVAIRPGLDPLRGVSRARTDLGGQVRGHLFPDEGDPAPGVVLPDWRATAQRLRSETDPPT